MPSDRSLSAAATAARSRKRARATTWKSSSVPAVFTPSPTIAPCADVLTGRRPYDVAMARPGSPAVVAACYGYELRSSLAFSFVLDSEPDTGLPGLEVVESDGCDEPSGPPLMEWMPRPGNELHARVYDDGIGFRLWTDLEGWFGVDVSGPCLSVPSAADPLRREVRLWGVPAGLCYIARGDFPLHAAAVDVGGRALVLAAPGRFGKTTLAAAFLSAGHRLLAEDFVCCRPSTTPEVVPGPALLRVRRDVYDALQEVQGAVPVVEAPDRVLLSVDPKRRGGPAPVPLRAVIFLREHEGRPTLEPVPAERALPDLWTLAFRLPTEADRRRCFDNIAAMAARVSFWNLRRPLRLDVLPEVVELLTETCARPAGSRRRSVQ